MKLHLPWIAAVLALAASLSHAQPVGDWFIMRTSSGSAFMALSDETGGGALTRGCVRRQCMWVLSHKSPCTEGATTSLRLLAPKGIDAAARCMGPSGLNTGMHDWMFTDESGIEALVRRGVKFKVQAAPKEAGVAPLKFNAHGGARALKRLGELLSGE